MTRHLLWVAFPAWLAAAGVIAAPVPESLRARMVDSRRVGGEVVAAFDTQERVRVVVVYGGSAAQGGPGATRTAAVAAGGAALLRTLAPADFAVRRQFSSIRAVVGDITAGGIGTLLDSDDVVRIDVDAAGGGHLVQAVPLVRLDAVHTAGFTGDGVTVAVLDTGYDARHPDLRDDLVAEQCFCSSASGSGGCCPNGASTQSGAGSAADDHGHGTNVSGIITSAGSVAPAGGAPDARVVAIKVIDRDNRFCCVSDVVAGLDWILRNRPDVRVVNMSLGSDALFAGSCDTATAWTIALAQAIDALRARGTVVFASSGNNGSGSQMAAPACVANTIAVGAVWDSNVGSVTLPGWCAETSTAADKVTCFSNTNAQTDLLAPGAPTTSTGLGGGTSTFYGTSQASPLAAACAACLIGARPGVSADEVETALKLSPTHLTDTKNGLSFPRLDCQTALAPLPPCVGGTTIGKAMIKLTKTGAPSGDEALVFSGRLAFAPGTPTIFNPPATGVQVLVEDIGAAAALLDLSTRTTPVPPGGRSSGCDPRDGWVSNGAGTKHTYKNKSGFLDAACSVSANGLVQLTLTDKRTTKGAIEFKTTTKTSTLGAPRGPLRGTIVLGGTDASEGVACGSHRFAASACVAKATSLTCK